MWIKVVYKDNQTKEYSSFGEIENYDDVKILNCGDNQLTELPERLPERLIRLDCGNNQLTKLPEHLPEGLERLYCGNNQLTKLPERLPEGLELLDCGGNQLTELPEPLPEGLEELYCIYNQLTELPEGLPEGLERLYCGGNQLTELPEGLPERLIRLDCGGNQLKELPERLPERLILLYCSCNKLTELPERLPEGLEELYCIYNKLTELPEGLPERLTRLDCGGNQLKELPERLPEGLIRLDCGDNQLTKLPEHLPEGLESLDCGDNQLKELPERLPERLTRLYCGNNQLTKLPEHLPEGLQLLNCIDNRLTALPLSLIECGNLFMLAYEGNEIEYIPPVLTMFINRILNTNGNTLQVYNDSQSVHNHNIQTGIRDSIYNLLRDKPKMSFEEVLTDITEDKVLTEGTKEALYEYASDYETHSVIGIRFSDILTPVWNRIVSHPESEEIKRILVAEMTDSLCMCFTGRLSRLVNTLNGYYEDVRAQISDNDQISNIVLLERKSLGDDYTVELHRERVAKELINRGFDQETIDVWTAAIE